MPQALSLFVNPMPPRTTGKSYRPRVSDRTMVATRTSHPFRLLRFRNRIESAPLLSLFVDPLRTVLAVKGRGKGRSGNTGSLRHDDPGNTLAPSGRDQSRGTTPPRAGKAREEGAGCQGEFSPGFSSMGKYSLDIPFYRTIGWPDFFGSPGGTFLASRGETGWRKMKGIERF